MARDQIEEVKNKTDIVSLISEYIEVKKAGRNYKANCPFHGEKTPSFMISPELQMYKCFGCSKSGDVFTFLEEHEGMEFGEALKYLAEKVGVKLTFVKQNETSEKEKIIEINKSTLNFYNYALTNHPNSKKVLEYLTKDRGLTQDIIKKFNIGYAPEEYDALSKYLVGKKKHNSKDLQLSGLLVGRGTDRFRGRVIFPLFDHKGSAVGFAGRILPWQKQDMAKYINSPETPAYHKSKILFGLNITKSEIRNSDFAVIVEGELDMISSYAAGIRNVVAIKGSALTEDQIRLVGRFCKKIVLCLDSDFAGDEAAKRGAVMAVNMGFEVKVASLKSYKDPDEIARKDPEGYKKAIEEAVDIWDFLINKVFDKYDSNSGGGKAHISSEIVPLLRLIQDKIVQDYYVEKVARRLSVSVEAVTSELNKVKSENLQVKNESKQVEDTKKTRRLLLEERLLANMISKKADEILVSGIHKLFLSEKIKKITQNLETFLKENKTFNLTKFSTVLPKEIHPYFSEIMLNNSEEEETEGLVKELKSVALKEEMEDLGQKIRQSEAKQDSDSLLKYQKEYADLAKKLSTLE